MLDLKPEDLAIVCRILAFHVPDVVVWAYRSRANGKAHEGSDLDLVLINPKDTAIPQENMSDLRNAFSESNLPILVDVLDWARIPDSFKEAIKRHHEIIQSPK
jgi:predicted nucleotidyltransferase